MALTDEASRQAVHEAHLREIRALKTSQYWEVSKRARKLSAILGDFDPSERRGAKGIRILTMDGGGTKALAAIEILKEIQRQAGGKPIHELFDIIGGVR